MAYTIIAQVDDMNTARVLAVALRAHGFHPLEQGDGGLPGVRSMFAEGGYPVRVPEEEASDATVLARDLLNEMKNGSP